MFSVVLGQCTDSMKAKLEVDKDYSKIANDSDVISLLALIREISYDYESQRYPYLAIHSALKAYCTQGQDYNTTSDAYMESFTNLQEFVTHCGGE